MLEWNLRMKTYACHDTVFVNERTNEKITTLAGSAV